MKAIKILLILFGLQLITSCTDLNLYPLDQLSEATFFESEEDAMFALTGIYEMFRHSGSWEQFIGTEGITNNAESRGGYFTDEGTVALAQHNPSSGPSSASWSGNYTGIQRANYLLENIDKSPISEAEKSKFTAEAKFLRAMFYFLLWDRFGGVPIVLERLTIEEYNTIARSSKDAVVAQMLQDLNDAIAVLPESLSDADYGRASKYAALALKARILLYEEDYSGAIEAAEQIIPHYALYDDYYNMFQPVGDGNEEVIFDIQYIGENSVHGGPQDRYFSLGISPLQNFFDAYLTINGLPTDQDPLYDPLDPWANRDPRLYATVDTINRVYTDLGPSETGYYLRKAVNDYGDIHLLTASAQNLIIFRHTDVLLMLAEAKNELNQFNAAEWDRTIRLIRERAGFTAATAVDFPGGTQDELRQIIRHERRMEMAFEGTWYSDIRRWGILVEELKKVTYDNRGELAEAQPDIYYLWPIPQSDIDKNPNLIQNPGY